MMICKSFLCLALVQTMTAGCIHTSADPPSGSASRGTELPRDKPFTLSKEKSFALSIRPSAPIVESGHPVIMVVTIRNITDKMRTILNSTPERDIWLRVDNDKYERIPLTRLGTGYENRLDWPFSGRQVIEMNPGAQREYEIIANRFFDMTVSGKYLIRASFFVPRDSDNPTGEQLKVTSNVATVEVLP